MVRRLTRCSADTVRPVTGAAQLFTSAALAAGYAHDRPPVHAHLMARVPRHVIGPARTALDVGCGAGASTVALRDLAARRIGIDPAPAMVGAARATGDEAAYLVARAEALPLAAGTVDLIGAAGALNFADLGAFVAEADRVLGPDGAAVVSDYGFGVPAAAPDWPQWFAGEWPRPAAAPVTAESFGGGPFAAVVDDAFAVTLPMTRAAYVAYALTDTRVAHAEAGGTARAEVAQWCEASLPRWEGDAAVTFAATLLVLRRVSRT